MSSHFDLARCRAAYEKQLKPGLLAHKPLLCLDDRNEFYLKLLAEQSLLEPGTRLVDLGAGLSIFGPLCSALGMKVTLVDDFGGGGGVELGRRPEDVPLLDVFENRFGLTIVRQNFLEGRLPLPEASVDVVTCFHSLEHWHQSPRPLFKDIVRILKPGGFLIIATPNAVNLRKRVYVPFGLSNLPTLHEWYHEGDPVFRGHVREPVIRDLHQLLKWNGFKVVATYGRNFIGRDSQALNALPRRLVSAIAIVSGWGLKFFPSLCSDIHVVGQKPLEDRP